MNWPSILASEKVSAKFIAGEVKLFIPPSLSNSFIDELRANKPTIISELMMSISFWVHSVNSLASISEIQNTLDFFRPLEWTDLERAEMAQACERKRQSLYIL